MQYRTGRYIVIINNTVNIPNTAHYIALILIINLVIHYTMKKIIAWPATRVLFSIGHLISRTNIINTEKGYTIYNRLMGLSLQVQLWAKLNGPWKKPENT